MTDSRTRQLIRSGLAACAFGGILLGCSGTDTTGIPAFKTINPYAQLQLNVRAAVMSTVAPYDTLQLIPTAYDVNGNNIPLPGPVTYTVNDTTIKVNSTGLIRLVAKPSSSAMVVVSVQDTSLNLTHTDTAFIAGVTTAPTSRLASFSIRPTGSDSAVLDMNNGTKTLDVAALDATGKVIPVTSLALHFMSENLYLAKINAKTGAVSANAPGSVRLTATTTYFGVTKTDSLDFRIGYPDTLTLQQEATALPDGTYHYYWNWSNLVTGVGKTVVFAIPDLQKNPSNNLLPAGTSLPIGDRFINEGVSAVFDDSSAPQASSLSMTYLAASFASNGSGNVNLQIPDSVVVVDSIGTSGLIGQWSVKFTNYCKSVPLPCATARSFPTAGVYHYQSPTTGAAGTITVVAP